MNNAGYTGVTGRSSGQMYHAAYFAFDFDDVWKIDEGNSTPYLRTFLVVIEPVATIEPLDEGASEADVRTQTARFADSGIDETIGGSVEKWNDFVEWANGTIGDADAVLANAHVAAAFLLGAVQPTVSLTADGDSSVKVVFNIAEHLRVRIDNVEFEGMTVYKPTK